MKILYAVIAVLALIVGASLYAGHRRTGELKAAHDSLTVALRAGDNAVAHSRLLSDRAAQAETRAARADSAASALARRARRAEAVYVAVRDSAPAACAPVIEAADSALAIEQERGDSLASALQNERSALADTRAALDSVRGSYERLRTAAVTLDKAAQPSWRERVIPKLGVGGAAGIDPFTRRPATAVGITLGWTF